MFTVFQLLETARDIAHEDPDFIYTKWAEKELGNSTQCVYFSGNTPACLFGHAFDRLGVPATKIMEIANKREEEGTGSTIFDIISDLVEEEIVEIDDLFDPTLYEAISIMQSMQNSQDLGVSWGNLE